MLPCKVATFDKRQKLFLSAYYYCSDKIVQRSGMVDIWLSTDFVVGIGWCLGKLAGKHLARPTAQLWDATKPPSHIPHIWNQFLCEAAICHTLYLHSGGKFIWSLRGCDTKCLHVHSVIKPSVGHVSAFIAQTQMFHSEMLHFRKFLSWMGLCVRFFYWKPQMFHSED